VQRSTKLILDILMGAVVPIALLNLLTAPLGAPLAYLLAALVPVGWVLLDLLVLTRQFNAITAVAGMIAIGNGALAFWFVDGLLFALKDSVGLVLYTAMLAGSIAIGQPFLRPLFRQVMGAITPERRAVLDPYLNEPSIRRTVTRLTLALAVLMAIVCGINVWLNLSIVVAAFGTESFNQQVAQVNAITRIVFPLVTTAAIGLAVLGIYRAVLNRAPVPPDTPWYEVGLWDVLQPDSATTP
jgi:hypothetical protein